MGRLLGIIVFVMAFKAAEGVGRSGCVQHKGLWPLSRTSPGERWNPVPYLQCISGVSRIHFISQFFARSRACRVAIFSSGV